MFKRIGNFLKRLFGKNKILYTALFRIAVYHLLLPNKALATRIANWSNVILNGIKDETILGTDRLAEWMERIIAKEGMTGDEQIVVNTLLGEFSKNLKAAIDEEGITNNLKQLGKAAELIQNMQAAAVQVIKETSK